MEVFQDTPCMIPAPNGRIYDSSAHSRFLHPSPARHTHHPPPTVVIRDEYLLRTMKIVNANMTRATSAP